jgi:hypothetical protein
MKWLFRRHFWVMCKARQANEKTWHASRNIWQMTKLLSSTNRFAESLFNTEFHSRGRLVPHLTERLKVSKASSRLLYFSCAVACGLFLAFNFHFTIIKNENAFKKSSLVFVTFESVRLSRSYRETERSILFCFHKDTIILPLQSSPHELQ